MKRRIVVLLNSIAFCRAPCVIRLIVSFLSNIFIDIMLQHNYYP